MSTPEILSVTELTRQIKASLEGNFPEVWVQGEVSNCKVAGSGHVYFSIKDEGAQIAAVAWRGTAARLKFPIQDGLEVVASGAVEVYAPRGSYQLIVGRLLPVGTGALELAFRQLCQKLRAEGLFDPARKRPLPRFPRRVALVTSPAGAAVHDMLQVIGRRWPFVDVVILPVAVQGAQAAGQIAAALRYVHNIPRVDVVITGRGGGSLEDLWAFNEEIVARAISQCRLPVVSAVGHEVDVTIADLVADRRALTPTEAAELVVPSQAELAAELGHLRQRLVLALKARAAAARARLTDLAKSRSLARPLDQLHDLARRLDDLDARGRRALVNQLALARGNLARVAASLEALSPLAVLARGYSVTLHHGSRQALRANDEVSVGQLIESRLRRGRLISRVEESLDV
jgi:exodeoxyribonuclease VII large subunit